MFPSFLRSLIVYKAYAVKGGNNSAAINTQSIKSCIVYVMDKNVLQLILRVFGICRTIWISSQKPGDITFCLMHRLMDWNYSSSWDWGNIPTWKSYMPNETGCSSVLAYCNCIVFLSTNNLLIENFLQTLNRLLHLAGRFLRALWGGTFSIIQMSQCFVLFSWVCFFRNTN